jgi:hypothetical protein
VALGPTHRELAACGAESKGRHPARPRRRNRWFVDSPLEEGDSAPGAPRRRSGLYRMTVLRVLDVDLRLQVARFERPDQSGGPKHLLVKGIPE